MSLQRRTSGESLIQVRRISKLRFASGITEYSFCLRSKEEAWTPVSGRLLMFMYLLMCNPCMSFNKWSAEAAGLEDHARQLSILLEQKNLLKLMKDFVITGL